MSLTKIEGISGDKKICYLQPSDFYTSKSPAPDIKVFLQNLVKQINELLNKL